MLESCLCKVSSAPHDPTQADQEQGDGLVLWKSTAQLPSHGRRTTAMGRSLETPPGAHLLGQMCAGSHLRRNTRASTANIPRVSPVAPGYQRASVLEAWLKYQPSPIPALLYSKKWTSEFLVQIYTFLSASSFLAMAIARGAINSIISKRFLAL